MGAYLSKPTTDKTSEDETYGKLSYGASSMQGWRVSQEDAHNAILDYGESMSFFAVYDGHGGGEVAEYTAEYLPNFLKETELFKCKDYSKGLTEAFLQFDAKIVEPEVLSVLKEIAGQTVENRDSESEAEEISNLYKEASMPLEDVMAQYSEKNKFQYPATRPRASMELGTSSSSMTPVTLSSCMTQVALSSVSTKLVDSLDSEEIEPDKISTSSDLEESKSSVQENCDTKETKPSSEEAKSKATDSENNEISTEVYKNDKSTICNGESVSKVDISDSSSHSVEPNYIKESAKCKPKINGKNEGDQINGFSKTEDDCKENIPQDSDSSSSTNGSTAEINAQLKVGKGKGFKKGKNIVSYSDIEAMMSSDRERRKSALAAIYKQIQESDESLSDEDDSDEEEEIEEELEEEDESNEECDEDADADEDEDEDDEEDCGEEDCGEESGEYQEFPMCVSEEPGFDSGCTACVTLLHGSRIYVANVGDSRCVVCREGEAVDLSIDHKPEDEIESNRITKAGGRVTPDGRVNGGLNLSRALGDHRYKLNKTLKPEEQMISPLPDIQTLDITPKDSFMIIACDGIWNSMSSQEACDFVTTRLDKEQKLSAICEEMFDFCLAPNIDGDGAGCDNMTCIIVRLDKLCESTNKRPCEDIKIQEEDMNIQHKKAKLEKPQTA